MGKITRKNMITNRLKITKKNSVRFLFAVLALLTVGIYGFEIDLSYHILMIIALLIVLLGDDSEIVAIAICCIPLYNCFEYLYVVLFATIVLILRNISYLKIGIPFLIVLTIFTWEIIHCFFTDFSIRIIVSMIVPYVFICVLQMYDIRELDYSLLVRVFAIFTVIVCFNLVMSATIHSGGNIIAAIANIDRLGKNLELSDNLRGTYNPNSLGIICVLAISGLLQKYLYIEKRRTDLVCILILIIMGILTQSRTYLICLILMVMLFLFAKKETPKENIKFFLLVITIGILSIVILRWVSPETLNDFFNRWNEKDLSNGRFAILKDSITCIFSNITILGFGLGCNDYFNRVLRHVSVAPHDGITEILMAWGLPGLIIFTIFLLVLVFCANKKNKHINIVCFVPLFILLFKGLLGHWITSGYTMLAFSFAYLSLCQDFTQVDLQKKDHLI